MLNESGHEPLGRRIGDLRAKLGLTQQELADRIAVSRTAVSHLEAGMTVPSERTIVLLAGAFKVEPRDLVAGTLYPAAKTERLPAVAARYTELELLDALLELECTWLERIGADADPEMAARWEARLDVFDPLSLDRHDRDLLEDLRRRAKAKRDQR